MAAAAAAGHSIPRAGSAKAAAVLVAPLPNASEVLTPEVLFEAINGDGTIADTIFQAVINVEKDVWNVSLPELSVGPRWPRGAR